MKGNLPVSTNPLESHDPERGKRFAALIAELFQNQPRIRVAKALGVAETTIRKCEQGMPISNIALANLAHLGANLNDLLIGSTPSDAIGLTRIRGRPKKAVTEGGQREASVSGDTMGELLKAKDRIIELTGENGALKAEVERWKGVAEAAVRELETWKKSLPGKAADSGKKSGAGGAS